MEKPVLGPRQAVRRLRDAIEAGERPAVMFGPEAAGLENEDIARADAILTFPVNPGFPNAVALFAFAYGEARQAEDVPGWFERAGNPPATQAELEGFFRHLEDELERGRFFHPPDKTLLMRHNLRAPFLRARLTQQEAQTLRGVIKALTIGRGGRKKSD
jgi:tRNA/rRNA methyltransferase